MSSSKSKFEAQLKEKVIQRAIEDPSFRESIQANPRRALEEAWGEELTHEQLSEMSGGSLNQYLSIFFGSDLSLED